MNLIDNFLNKDEFLFVKNNILSDEFPWFFNEHSLNDKTSHFQFIHNFFNQNTKRQFYQIIEPIVKKINPIALERVKGNCNTKTTEIIETGIHQDSYDKRLTSSVFFVNDCDGYCKIEGNKIYSKQNRLVTFSSSSEHTGTTCTDKSRRVLINLVYLASL